MDMTYLARQPIISKTGEILGYEILFRDERTAFELDEESVITSAVVNSIVNVFGIESIVGNYLGFIKVNRAFLEQGLFKTLPKEQFVFSLFERELSEPQAYQPLIKLAKAGYRFAINDTSLHHLPDDPTLLKAIHFLKVDTVALAPEQCRDLFEQCQHHNIEVIASKVENHDVYDAFYDLGASYFQGYFLSKPKLFENATIRADDQAVMQVWNLLEQGASTDELVNALEAQHALAVQLLRFVNSAFFSLKREVTSIRHLIVLLGRKQLSNWLMLLLVSQVGSRHKNGHPLMLMVINRTEIMTGLLRLLRPDAPRKDFESAYLVGMLSLIHLLFHMLHREVLRHLNVSKEIEEAMFEAQNFYGELLTITRAIEHNDTKTIDTYVQRHHLDPAKVNLIIVEAMKKVNDFDTALAAIA